MTDAPTLAETQPPLDPRAERAQRRVQRLEELADIGMEIARDLRRQVQARAQADAQANAASAEAPKPAPGPDLSLMYSRVSRALRLTLMLQERLDQDEAARARAVAEAAAAKARSAEIAVRIEAEVKGDEAAEALSRIIDAEEKADPRLDALRLHERLETLVEDETWAADFLERPLGEIIVEISDALGLDPDWSLWSDEPWAPDAAKAVEDRDGEDDEAEPAAILPREAPNAPPAEHPPP